jgi:hypothetical protein
MKMTEEEIDTLKTEAERASDLLYELGASNVLILCSVDTEERKERSVVSGRGSPFARDGMALRFAIDGDQGRSMGPA